MSALGTILLWIGWGAFNGGSALAFNLDVAPIIGHTMITAAAGGIAAVVASMTLYKHIRVEVF